MPIHFLDFASISKGTSRRAVVFGAGAIGRGFIGEILLDAGWTVIFIDASASLVAALTAGSYPHDTVAPSGVRRKLLAGCTAIPVKNLPAVSLAVAEADVIFTSVGSANLPQVASALTPGLVKRHTSQRGPVDIFLAENVHDGANVVRDLLTQELYLQQDSDPADVLGNVGIVETSIGRMIPIPTAVQRLEHPALVAAEPFRELPFDLAACQAPIPDVPDLLGRNDVGFSFYTERKLYIHNHGHCLTAYLGALAGLDEIAPAITDARIADVVRSAMYATAKALAAKYEQSLPPLVAHVDDLLVRFANTALHDTVERVGRDPERKLQTQDRFLGALSLTAEWGDPSDVLPSISVAAHQLTLSRPGEDPKKVVAPVGSQVFRIAPSLVERFDELLATLLDGAELEDFLNRLMASRSDWMP